MTKLTVEDDMSFRQGLYLVKTPWIEARLAQPGHQFEQQYFTITERHRPQIRAPYAQYLAGRFAAKAAILQIFHIQPETFHRWQDIEIKNLPHGEPVVTIRGDSQAWALEHYVTDWLLSISHTPAYATASAIALIKH